ncbi:MAG TPA: MBL fold metallo-hydrolase [Clostridiales bacterium]|nr:MBL fold metallo-hydrolase [Clostridiales bacterium]
MNDFWVKFYGVRGTYPVACKQMLKYGGNTSCVYMKADREDLIFDAGTGIIVLGKEFEKQRMDANIFITHMHIDHIQGLTFFMPMFMEEKNTFKIYCKDTKNLNFKEHFYDFVKEPLFPFTPKDFKANMDFRSISQSEIIDVSETVKVHMIDNNHPDGGISYKIICNNKSCCYITDNEIINENRDKFKSFMQNADVAIIDATYNLEEYETKKGWGHSTWETIVKLAKEANVKQLFLFHHEPTRTDKELDQIQRKVRRVFKNAYCAKEGVRVIV